MILEEFSHPKKTILEMVHIIFTEAHWESYFEERPQLAEEFKEDMPSLIHCEELLMLMWYVHHRSSLIGNCEDKYPVFKCIRMEEVSSYFCTVF